MADLIFIKQWGTMTNLSAYRRDGVVYIISIERGKVAAENDLTNFI